MTDLRPSDIVQSLAGHDRGELFIILRTEEGFACVADGRLRKGAKPKRKNVKHLAFRASCTSPVAERILRGESVADSEIRKALAPYRAAATAKGGN